MAATPRTPANNIAFNSVPDPSDPSHLSKGYGAGSRPTSTAFDNTTNYADFGAPNNNAMSTPQVDGSGEATDLQRSVSTMSQSQTLTPSRGGTLKKKSSLRKQDSLRRNASKRSSRAGSVRSLTLGEKEKYEGNSEYNSAFTTPVPISGSPTEILANRFQGMRILTFPVRRRGGIGEWCEAC